MQNADSVRFHVLLVAIDDYEDCPLNGCVNDANEMERFLIERVGIPASSIKKLVAPRVPGKRPSRDRDTIPSADNIIRSLKDLAGDRVQQGDRVLFYYAGHGSFEKIPAAESYFEGLVPLDYDHHGLIFDVELNLLLQDIAQRSRDLTVILDCCHSAGATRNVLIGQDDVQARFLPLDEKSDRTSAQVAERNERALRALGAGRNEPVQEYTVVAACHADECTVELRIPPRVGSCHGLLTFCLLDVLGGIERAALEKLRWSDIWEPLKALMNSRNPSQRAQLLGPAEHRVFGGPHSPEDPGYSLARNADGSYLVRAGSLAGLGTGALLAAYGPETALFPPIDSPADIHARLGLLKVESADPAQSLAWLEPRDSPFMLPITARCRLIKQGLPERLRVSLARNVDARLRELLKEDEAKGRFVLLPDGAGDSEARVGQYPDGSLWIGDDLSGPGLSWDASSSPSPGPLARIEKTPSRSLEDMAIGLCAGLNHYAQYVIPLRLHRNGGYGLPAQSVEIRLLDCNQEEHVQQLVRDASSRREVRKDRNGRYLVRNGDRVAIQVHNRLPASTDLHLSLLLCNMEGQIQLLDSDVLLKGRSGKIFWLDSVVGSPFAMVVPDGCAVGIDRLMVLATDQKGLDLSPLNQKQNVQQAIESAMTTRHIASRAIRNATGARWTVAQALIQISRP